MPGPAAPLPRPWSQVPLPAGAVVSAYWPMASELDPRPLMSELESDGHAIALPERHAPSKLGARVLLAQACF